MNRGDAFNLNLDIKVDDVEITQGQYDDIELTFNKQSTTNCVQKNLGNGIEWSDTQNKYVAFISQEDTYKLLTKNTWQIRLYKLVDNQKLVVSNTVTGSFNLGDVNSSEVLG